MTQLRVLHLEDSSIDAELIREMLTSSSLVAEIDRVETRDQYVAALDRHPCYDLILADYSLPAFDGLSALELARERCPDVPFLFVTGALKDDSAVETLRRGATDFIVKQRLIRLVPAIQRAIRERDERFQRERAESALQFLVKASARLAASLDLEAILGNLAQLSIPTLADFCIVDLSPVDGDGEHVATAHVELDKVGLLGDLRFRSSEGVELHGVVSDDHIETLTAKREHGTLLRALRPVSLILVPLVVGGRTLGSVAFAYASVSGRSHDARDVATAQNLAERAAVAVENARLYREVQREVKSRNDLLAIVSHDLRNPMQNIMMTAAMMQQKMASADPLRPRVDAIAKSAGLASRLLGDLLDLARFESGIELERRLQDLSPVVNDCIELVASLAEQKQIQIINTIRSGEVSAFCDRTRVCQILGNLIGNALKFTPPDGTITISAQPAPERNKVRITVADTGAGIPAEDIPHLFERYWQAKAGGGGVGLGLSIVKALVDAQGGHVSVTSEIGRGTSFTFTLLTSEPAAVAPDALAPTVLVVDDDAETRITVAQVLEEAGYRTLTAGDGLEALELLRREPHRHPSVILLDLEMPKMNARAFCAEQQRDPALKDIAVIVFSADDDVARVAGELHATGHLHKPLGVDELLAAVGHYTVPTVRPEVAPLR